MANQTVQLGELLASAGASVTLIQVNPPYRPDWVSRFPVVRSLFRLLPYWLALWRAANRSDIFHIMANSGWSWHLFAAPAIWVAHFRGVASVVNYRGGEAGDFLLHSGGLVRFSMRRTRALIVPSGFLHAVFTRFGMRSEVVPNIIDLARFHPRSMFRSGPPNLFVARNLELLYDNATAIRAFGLVRQVFPDARLTIAGSGPEEPSLRQIAIELGLVDAIRFAGRLGRDAMAFEYRSADIALNPSRADNMPNSLLEAWASGVPVVSTNVGGVPFIAKDGANASLVPVADPDAMAQACISLLSDPALWRKRAEAGLLEVQRYTWSRVEPVLRETYERAMRLHSMGK